MISLFLSLLLVAADPATSTTTWPGFRGDGSSQATAKDLPTKWSPTENIAWRTNLPGYGQSSPVVCGDLAYVTAIDGNEKEKLFVVAVDLKSGKIVWKKEFSASQKGRNNPVMSRGAPTPVVDASGVFAFFESGDLIAMSPKGEVRWQKSLVKEYGEFKNNHGVGCSPTQTENAVVVVVDHAGPSYVVAFDKSTGKELWKTERTSRSSWTSPIVCNIDGKETLIVSSGGTVDAYEANSGKLLASQEGLFGNNITSPSVIAGGKVIIGAGDNPRKPDPEAAAKSNCCLQLSLKGDKASFEKVWEGRKAVSHHASPVVNGDLVYYVTRIGVLHAVDLKTGEERFTERLGTQCWATPIAAGEHVYFFGKDGVTVVIKAGPKFEKVATNRLWSSEDFTKRFEEAKKKAAENMAKDKGPGKEKAPGKDEGPGKGPGGRPLSKEDMEAARYSAVGDLVYGAAAIDGTLIIRSDSELICIRTTKSEK